MANILLVEDAREYQELVTRLLNQHKVFVTEDPDTVFSILDANSIDLIILDITLPKRDGFTVLHELQSYKNFANIPVICLTGKDQTSDKVMAFSLGADDYIQKPFNSIEFKARLDAKLSRITKSSTRNFEIGDLTVDLTSHKVMGKEHAEIFLTQTEFKLLLKLGKHPEQVFSREQLLAAVWGDEGAVFDRAVDVHICSLRKKVGHSRILLKSVAGVGYKLVIDRDKSQKVA